MSSAFALSCTQPTSDSSTSQTEKIEEIQENALRVHVRQEDPFGKPPSICYQLAKAVDDAFFNNEFLQLLEESSVATEPGGNRTLRIGDEGNVISTRFGDAAQCHYDLKSRSTITSTNEDSLPAFMTKLLSIIGTDKLEDVYGNSFGCEKTNETETEAASYTCNYTIAKENFEKVNDGSDRESITVYNFEDKVVNLIYPESFNFRGQTFNVSFENDVKPQVEFVKQLHQTILESSDIVVEELSSEGRAYKITIVGYATTSRFDRESPRLNTNLLLQLIDIYDRDRQNYNEIVECQLDLEAPGFQCVPF